MTYIHRPEDGSLVLHLDAEGSRRTDNKASDLSNYGNHGTITGNTYKSGTTGNQVFNFDGIDDYIDCGNGVNLNLGTNDFTLCCWIKKNSTSTLPLISKGASGTSIGYITRIGTDHKLRLIMSSTGSNNVDYEESKFVLSLGKWYFVTLAANRDDFAYFYVDGVKGIGASIAAQNGNLDNSTNQLIGSYPGLASYFGGEMNDIRIYNRALSSSEISRIYNDTKSNYGK